MKEVIGVSLETSTNETSRTIADLDEERPSRRNIDPRRIAELAASMALEGLRHPILIMPNGNVLKGRRRMAAARTLGWTVIQAREVHYVEEAVDALWDCKDEMAQPRTIEEWVELGLAIETLDHRDAGTADNRRDYAQFIGAVVASSGSAYKRGRYVVLAAKSQRKPLHVVTVAKTALAAIDMGTLTITGGFNRVRAAEKANVADVVSDDGLPTTQPPSPQARSPRARLLREEWIRALAAKGATSQQIADRLGITVHGLRKIAADMGQVISADQVLAGTQRRAVDPNKAMRVAIDDLDALIWSLDRIDVTQLDPDLAAEWASLLGGYARGINRVSRIIKGVL